MHYLFLTAFYLSQLSSAFPARTSSQENSLKDVTTSVTLSPGATCRQLDQYQYSSQFWDLTNTSAYFEDWVHRWNISDRKTLFENDFRAPWGMYQDWDCSADDATSCGRPNCGDLQEQQDSPGSAAAYQVMLSMANLGQVFQQLAGSVEAAIEWWGAMQSEFSAVFDPRHDVSGNAQWTQQVINGIVTIGATVAALLGIVFSPALAIGAIIQAIAMVAVGVGAGINYYLATIEPSFPESELSRLSRLSG